VLEQWKNFLDKYSSSIDLQSAGLSREIENIIRRAEFKIVKNLKDRGEVRRIIEQEVDKLTKNYVTLLDYTAAPRPSGLAYFQLAEKYKTPLIYIFHDWMTGKSSLCWEIGRKELEEELAFMTPDKERREELKSIVEGIKGERKTRIKEKELTR
jgi:hypothetical protein